jgi:hypothetical protein
MRTVTCSRQTGQTHPHPARKDGGSVRHQTIWSCIGQVCNRGGGTVLHNPSWTWLGRHKHFHLQHSASFPQLRVELSTSSSCILHGPHLCRVAWGDVGPFWLLGQTLNPFLCVSPCSWVWWTGQPGPSLKSACPDQASLQQPGSKDD